MYKQIKGTGLIVLTLVLGAVLGAILSSNIDLPLKLNIDRNVGGVVFAEERPVGRFVGEDIFADVAEKVMPVVVTVYSEQTIRVRRPDFWFGPDDDFFRRFFDWPDYSGRRRDVPQFDEYTQRGLGSGVVVTPDGYILTNNHVVSGADDIKVKVGDETYEAEIIGFDDKTDLAVLKIEPDEPLAAAVLGDSEDIRIGQWVLAIGHPFGLDHTVTAGIISAKGRNHMGITDYEDFLQTDAAINPGNSGGALVDLDGNVIGINTAIASRTGQYSGVGFAIPVNMAKSIMNQLIEFGKVVRGYIGIGIQDVTPELAEAFDLNEPKGVLVTQVLPDLPGEKAGLKQGDIVIELDGKEVKDASDLRNKISATPPGTEINLTIVRDGKEKRIDITLAELPGVEEPGVEITKDDDIPNLGMELAKADENDIAPYGYSGGLVIENVKPGSPAAAAGLSPGDLIFEVNRKQVKSVSEYNKLLAKSLEGKPILLLVGKDGGLRYIAVSRGDE